MIDQQLPNVKAIYFPKNPPGRWISRYRWLANPQFSDPFSKVRISARYADNENVMVRAACLYRGVVVFTTGCYSPGHGRLKIRWSVRTIPELSTFDCTTGGTLQSPAIDPTSGSYPDFCTEAIPVPAPIPMPPSPTPPSPPHWTSLRSSLSACIFKSTHIQAVILLYRHSLSAVNSNEGWLKCHLFRLYPSRDHGSGTSRGEDPEKHMTGANQLWRCFENAISLLPSRFLCVKRFCFQYVHMP